MHLLGFLGMMLRGKLIVILGASELMAFSTDRYLQRFFLADERLQAAQHEIVQLEDPAHVVPGDHKLDMFTSLRLPKRGIDGLLFMSLV